MHDFRFVEGKTHTNVIFDLAVPFELRDSVERLKRDVAAGIHDKNSSYYAVIQVDFV